jgi:hypothetical protein
MIVCMPELSVSNVYPIETAGTHDVLIIHSDILSSSDIYTFAVSNVYPIETAGKYSFLFPRSQPSPLHM